MIKTFTRGGARPILVIYFVNTSKNWTSICFLILIIWFLEKIEKTLHWQRMNHFDISMVKKISKWFILTFVLLSKVILSKWNWSANFLNNVSLLGHITNQKHFISTSIRPIITKHGRVVAYRGSISQVTCSFDHVILWENKKCISTSVRPVSINFGIGDLGWGTFSYTKSHVSLIIWPRAVKWHHFYEDSEL